MAPPVLSLTPSETTSAPPAHGWPVLRLGFRPFYLVAAVFACLAVPLWVALFLGHITLHLTVAPMLWHAHEMLFGFATAVIIGFLLTAGKAWTGLATPRGVALGALVMLWAAARVAAFGAPYPVYAGLDLVLLPLMAAVFARVLLRAGNRRNLPLAMILVLLSLANLAFHLAVTGIVDLPPVRALYAGLALIVIIECVMAGRVVPAFTMSATPGLKLKTRPLLERAILSVTALALLLWVFAPPGPITFVAFALAAALHLIRQWQWRPWVTRTRPILWILHAAYAWIALAFVLLALAQIGWATESAGVHALAIGATGGLIIAMMTRTARGHTGRPLRASKIEVAAYALVMAAAAVRVFVPLAAPQLLAHALICAAIAWFTAFAIYLFVFAPWLLRPRLDGKDG
jgi:uncharacterized protein involved in response to NO